MVELAALAGALGGCAGACVPSALAVQKSQTVGLSHQ